MRTIHIEENKQRKIIYENISEIKNNTFLCELEPFIISKGLHARFIDINVCNVPNEYDGIWLVYGTNYSKVMDDGISTHIQEAIKSQNSDSDFCIDFNLYKITNCIPYVAHQEIVRKVLLIEFITQCFKEQKKGIPDRISSYDALLLEMFYKEITNNYLNTTTSKNHKNFQKNSQIINKIVSNYDCTYNALQPDFNKQSKNNNKYFFSSYERFRQTILKSFCIPNKVSAQTVIRNSQKIATLCINVKIAKIITEKLRNYPNFLFYCSKPTVPKEFLLNSCQKKYPNSMKVCYFIIPESLKSDFLYIYYSVLYPNGFKYSIQDMKKIEDVIFFQIPQFEYPIFEKMLIKAKVPFRIDTLNNKCDEHNVCVCYNSSFTSQIIKLLSASASTLREEKIYTVSTASNSDYHFSVLQKYMAEHPENVISSRKD